MKTKKFLVPAVAVTLTGVAFGQADECAAATDLGTGSTSAAFDTNNCVDTMAQATTSAEQQCFSLSNDVWFRYTAGSTGNATFSTCNMATFDTEIGVWEGADCSTMIGLGCNDDSAGCAGNTSEITLAVTAGQVYHIQIGYWSSDPTVWGAGTLDISEAGGPPANDECSGAIAVGVGATPFDTTAATTSAETWSCANGGSDLWYTYTAQASFGLRVETCGSGYDTGLQLFDGTCGALNEIACNDDDCTLQSGIDIIPTAGTTYYIRVGGFNAATGTGDLTVTEDLSPPNDECAGAVAIAAGAIPFDTTQATNSPEAWSCAGTGGSDLWYSYTATNCFPVTVETCGSGYDTALEVFRGDCSDLTLLACNDDACGLQSSITFSADIGETVLVRVGGFNGAAGTGTLTLTESPAPDSCVETIFASNNGGAVGGVVYFDATFSQDVSISGLNTNYSEAVGTPCGVEVYITPGTWVGVNSDPSVWTLVAVDDGTGVSAGDDNPTALRFAETLNIPAGSYGVALVAVDAGHDYTNGNGMNQDFMSADGVITLQLGGGANTPFSTQLFQPRVWNGGFCYNTDIGTSICGPAVPNSTGASGEITAQGSTFVCLDTLVLTASNLPANSFGYFLSSPTSGFRPNPGGSTGNLCLDGFIGRGVGGAILLADASGIASIGSTLTMPSPILIEVQILPGETWYFQYWHRDTDGMGGVTSNFTDAVEISFQ